MELQKSSQLYITKPENKEVIYFENISENR